MPLEVLVVLEKGRHKESLETIKKEKIENYVIANNNDCLRAMEKTAKNMGYKIITMQNFLATLKKQ